MGPPGCPACGTRSARAFLFIPGSRCPCIRHTAQRLRTLRVYTAQPKTRAPRDDVGKILTADIPDSEILHVPDIRNQLQEYDSPFCCDNNRGGGCAFTLPLTADTNLRWHCSVTAYSGQPLRTALQRLEYGCFQAFLPQ
jgi:hypothetical protein